MKKALGIIVVIALIAVGYQYQSPEEKPVFVPKPDSATLRQTTSGSLLGYTGANGAWTWRGIRYAKAPKGTLRWRAPLPAKAPRKGGIIETLASGNACAQLPSALSGPADEGRVAQKNALWRRWLIHHMQAVVRRRSNARKTRRGPAEPLSAPGERR